MIITKQHLSRRTLLKGLGVTVALPMLDAMTPALATAAEKVNAPTRLFFGAVPNGIEMKAWTPKGTGKDFEFTRILKPLEAYREDLLILTGLAHRTGASKEAGDHARAGGNYLTGVHPKRTTGADIDTFYLQLERTEGGLECRARLMRFWAHMRAVCRCFFTLSSTWPGRSAAAVPSSWK